ncbi:MAG: hypothetical protein K5891_03285 [Lachnospiraceae bacterium]|nr:hypothetical protein [Lachnospiraceae bacterium]
MKILKQAKGLLYGLLIPFIVYIFFGVLRPRVFLTGGLSTLYTILVQSITTCILGWGMHFSMTVGSLDFSIAAEMIMYEIIATIFYHMGGFLPMVLGTIACSFLFGMVKAFVKELIAVKSMVLGLALTYIIASIGEVLSTNRNTVIGTDATMLAGPPFNFIILIGTGLVMWYLLSRSRFGAHARAVGGNAVLAKSAGINEHVIGFEASMVGSVFAGIAAVFTLSRGAGVTAQNGLASIGSAFSALMCVFIAMFIGKYVSATVGIYIGAVTMSIISIGLVSIGFDSELNSTVTSAFLLILMTYTILTETRLADKVRREVAAARIRKDSSN